MFSLESPKWLKSYFLAQKSKIIGAEEIYIFLIMTMTSGHNLFLARVAFLEVR